MPSRREAARPAPEGLGDRSSARRAHGPEKARAAGTPGAALSIARIEQLRVFPQLGYHGDALILFWTDGDKGTRRLRGATVPVAT